MKLKKRILSTALAGAMVLGSTVSFAADFDLKNKNTGEVVKFEDYIFDDNKFSDIIFDLASYHMEANGGKNYDAQALVDGMKGGVSIEDAAKKLEAVETELKVESISAINTTTIKVTFNTEVTAEAAAKANFTLSKGTLEAANKTGEKEVTLSVAGLNYEDNVTVTVANPSYTKAVKVPAINELYTLMISTDSENDTIKSNGAATTMLTAKLVEKATGNVVVEDAQVQFTTTLGSLSQPQVALVNGNASTQLRSISSATSVTAVVNATIASAPGATQYVGLTGTKVVNFTPDGAGTGQVEMVSAVSAGADQGDRFYVKFSGDISAEDYKDVVTAAGWAGADFGVAYVNGTGSTEAIDVVDVYNLTSDTLMFVLDADVLGSVNPTVNNGASGELVMIDANYLDTNVATQGGNFLRDNVNHKVIFPGNVTGLVVNSSAIPFMMSDVTKPFIYGVDAKTAAGVASNMHLVVRASEALSQALTETTADAAGAGRAANQINGNFTIDGKTVRLDSAPTQANIDAAKAANEIIVTELYVGEYDATETKLEDKDLRKKVYISIHKDFKLGTGTHGIQIANIGDLAGHTDSPANKVTTQTFPFTVEADENIPTATVVAQSPEQWLITFDKPVDSITGKTISDALKIYTKEGYNATTKTPLAMNAGSGANDYKVSVVDENGVATTANLATNAQLSGVQRLLVEFNRDWSVKLAGNATDKDNYWKSGVNPFKVALSNVESLSGVDMAETAYDVAPQYDGTSPTIAEAQDLFEKSPNKVFRTLTATGSGQHVYVKMSEPVQLVTAGGALVSNPTTPNLEQDSASSGAYDDVDGLPRPTYRFVKGDKVVIGNAVQLAEDDMSFVITPATTLEAGEWTLYIEQISDDHGNTSATISKKVTVEQTAATVTDTKVAWSAFDNNAAAGTYDYIYVKFTKEMKAYTANGVDATTNYKFRGYDLPEGSQVFRGIDGVTDEWDGVTIRMPKTSYDGLTTTDFTTNMTIASNFQAADGEALSGDQPAQFELSDSAGTSQADKDGLGGTGVNGFEAVYYNEDATVIVGGVAVVKSEAKDSDKDGDIDTISITTSENANVTAATDFIIVNGKKFFNTAGNGSTSLTFVSSTGVAGVVTTGTVGTNEIAGTVSDTLTITTANGSIVTNTGKVVDSANPVLISATITTVGATAGFGNDVGDAITLKFSESVKSGFGVAGAPTVAELEAIFTASAGVIAGGTVTATDLSTTAGDTIVLTTTGALTTPIIANGTITTKAVPTAGDITAASNAADIAASQANVTVK